jgi:hypothetical protein
MRRVAPSSITGRFEMQLPKGPEDEEPEYDDDGELQPGDVPDSEPGTRMSITTMGSRLPRPTPRPAPQPSPGPGNPPGPGTPRPRDWVKR